MTDDVQVANRRLDASGDEALIGMARMGAGAFGYTADLRIDRGLAQLLRLRISQLNNCTYCLNLHYEAAREAGIPRAKIDTLTAYQAKAIARRAIAVLDARVQSRMDRSSPPVAAAFTGAEAPREARTALGVGESRQGRIIPVHQQRRTAG